MSAESLFGKLPAQYLSMIDGILPSFAGTRYQFVPLEEFEQVLRSNQSKGAQIYWREMLYRAHLAAASSIARGHRWLTGAIAAGDAGQLLPFAACLRGFLEAAADSYDGLAAVPFTFAENFQGIRGELEGAATTFGFSPDVENSLIHFTYAKRLSPCESKVLPDTHQAKTAAEYVKTLTNATIPEIKTLYSELCGLAHPAAESLALYVISSNGVDFTFTLDRECSSISELLEKYRGTLELLFSFGFNPATLILAVLLEFPMTELWCQPLKTWNLSRIGGWKRIEAAIRGAGTPA